MTFDIKSYTGNVAGKEIIIEPNRPTEGVTVAFIVENGRYRINPLWPPWCRCA